MPFGNGFVSVPAGVSPPSVLAKYVVIAVKPRVPNDVSPGARILRRRPEQPVAAAHHGLLVERPGGAAARRELVVRRIALMRRIAVDAGVHQPAAQVHARAPAPGNARSRSKPTVMRLSFSASPVSYS